MRLSHRWTDHLRTAAMGALIALTAAAARPMVLAAQATGGGGGDGAGGGGRMMAALFDGMTLTDAERKSIDSIRTNYQPQVQQARSSGDRSQVRDLMQKQNSDLRNVLTPDQQTTFDKNLATMRSRMQGMRRGGAGGGTPPSDSGKPQ